jgi:hypothetical protein
MLDAVTEATSIMSTTCDSLMAFTDPILLSVELVIDNLGQVKSLDML